jgi:hypothetical protein
MYEVPHQFYQLYSPVGASYELFADALFFVFEVLRCGGISPQLH